MPANSPIERLHVAPPRDTLTPLPIFSFRAISVGPAKSTKMMFQCRLSCVWAGSAAIASFGASSVHRQQDDMQRHNRDQVESTTDSAEVARGLLAARRHAAGTSEAAQWGRLV